MKEMDYYKLRGLIVSEHHSIKEFAQKFHYKTNAVYRMLNNKVDLPTSAIERFREELGILPEEIPVYFFTPKANKSY